jgi:hypothetical protein
LKRCEVLGVNAWPKLAKAVERAIARGLAPREV